MAIFSQLANHLISWPLLPHLWGF